MCYQHMVARVTPRKQFTGKMIQECWEIARTLGKAGTFQRLSTAYYFRRPRRVGERIPAEGLDFLSRDLSRVMSVDFMRSSFPQSELEFKFAPKPEYLLWNPPFLLYVDKDYTRRAGNREAAGAVLDAFCRWISALDAYYGLVYFRTYDRIAPFPASRPLGQPIPISDLIDSISWATYFGPELVEYLGRDRILTAPSWRIEPMDTGGILLLLAPEPLDPDVPEIRDVRQRVMRHLGLRPLPKQGGLL